MENTRGTGIGGGGALRGTGVRGGKHWDSPTQPLPLSVPSNTSPSQCSPLPSPPDESYVQVNRLAPPPTSFLPPSSLPKTTPSPYTSPSVYSRLPQYWPFPQVEDGVLQPHVDMHSLTYMGHLHPRQAGHIFCPPRLVACKEYKFNYVICDPLSTNHPSLHLLKLSIIREHIMVDQNGIFTSLQLYGLLNANNMLAISITSGTYCVCKFWMHITSGLVHHRTIAWKYVYKNLKEVLCIQLLHAC